MTEDQDASAASVELRHLRAFVTVAEEHNFTRAATRLRITQPALSRTIAQLERLVGASLLRRTRQSVQVTITGNQFLPHARRALAAVDEGIRTAHGESPWLRVGFTWGAAAEYTAPIVRAFERTHPDVTVELRRYDDTLAGLSDGRAHVGFLPGPPHDDRVRTLVLAEEPRVAALPADHILADHRQLLLSDLEQDALVINVVSGTTTTSLWEPGHSPETIVRVRNVDEWMEAIAAGRGIGLTAASTSRLYSHPQIQYRPIRDAPPVPIVLAWPHSNPHPLAADFIAAAPTAQTPYNQPS